MSFRRRSGPAGYPAYHALAQTYGEPLINKQFMANKLSRSTRLFQKDLRRHYGCVNAIDFSNRGGEFVVSGGDDRRVLVWNLNQCLYHNGTPTVMSGEHMSNIFCTMFDSANRTIFSGGNDDQVIQHDVATGTAMDIYPHINPVYGLSIHPECDSLFLTAGDSGKVLLWDTRIRRSETPLSVAKHRAPFHGAVFNPVDAHLVATANSRNGVELWDTRASDKCLQQYTSTINHVCTAMSVKWNAVGTYLTALRRHLPPVLYRVDRLSPIAEFCHPGYKNVYTMKNSCFGGDKDQFIISGSDDFNVYMWEIPEPPAPDADLVTVNRAFLVLSGHRSIVNQVRFSPHTHLIISTGVEKILKVWSPFPIGVGGTDVAATPRKLYSHDDYLNLVLESGGPLAHEYEAGTTDEDPRMLAFFDSLIQGKNTGWDSDSDVSPDDFYLTFPLTDSSAESEGDVDGADGVSLTRLREILAQHQSSQTGRSNSQALYRRLRRLSRETVLRELIGSDSASSSSSESSSSESEEGGDGAAGQDASPAGARRDVAVEFRACRRRGRRRYRLQRMRSSSSSSSDAELIGSQNGLLSAGNAAGASGSAGDAKGLTEGEGCIQNGSSAEQTDSIFHENTGDEESCTKDTANDAKGEDSGE